MNLPLDQLLWHLEHGDADQQAFAVHSLKAMKERVTIIGPKLIALLGHSDSNVPWACVDVLTDLGPYAFSLLQQALVSPQPQVRVFSALALLRADPASQCAIAELLRQLSNPQSEIRRRAACILNGVHLPFAPAIVPSPDTVRCLTTALDDTDEVVQEQTAGILGTLGAAAREAIPRLISLLQSENEFVRSAAANALGRIGDGSPEVITALLLLLNDEFSGVRLFAAAALRSFGSLAADAVPLLERLALHDPHPDTRRVARDALEQIRPRSMLPVRRTAPSGSRRRADQGGGPERCKLQ